MATNWATFSKLAVYSVALFASGLGVFFAVQRFGNDILRFAFGLLVGPASAFKPLGSSALDVAAAAAAVVVTNVVIAVYVWDAWAEEQRALAAPPPPPAAAPAAPAPAPAAGGDAAATGPRRRLRAAGND